MAGTMESGESGKGYHPGNIHITSSDYGYPDTHEPPSVIFSPPTGMKGLWHHPLTQVGLSFDFINLVDFLILQATLLGFVCFMCPGMCLCSQ